MTPVQSKITHDFIRALENFNKLAADAPKNVKPEEIIDEQFKVSWQERVVNKTRGHLEKLKKAVSEDNMGEIKQVASLYESIGKKMDYFGVEWTTSETQLDEVTDKLFFLSREIESV